MLLSLQYDDPNATISTILLELKSLSHSVDFPPAKLKTGAGEQCIDVVNKLCDSVLVQRDFKWARYVYYRISVARLIGRVCC